MPLVWPHDALPDVEAANQRSFALNSQYVNQAGQRALDQASFISAQAQMGFMMGQASMLRAGLGETGNAGLNEAILGANNAKGEPRGSIIVTPPTLPHA